MEFRDNQAIYLQIADLILEKVLAGIWKEGDKIPSVREFAADLEVNPNTVMRTFSYLQERGIIFNKRGIGYFVAETGREMSLSNRKEQFIKVEMPKLFKTMDMLGIDIKMLSELKTVNLDIN